MQCLGSVRPALIAFILLASPLAGATTISLTGTPGAAGTDGAAGNPGASGGPGGVGQSVDALANQTFCGNNSASAVGGTGGVGGTAGDGTPAGADGGNGGAGGGGGAATARAISTCPFAIPNLATLATATATGGNGGSGGAGGNASAGGLPGQVGATGVSGDAIAEVQLNAATSLIATGTAQAGATPSLLERPGNTANANSTVTNASGGAQSTATAAAGTSAENGRADANALATGTGPGPVGATAHAVGSGVGIVNATATAAGSSVTADARGTSDGTGAVAVLAFATGGGDGTTTAATAYGSGAGSAPVSVQAWARNVESELVVPDGDLLAKAEGHSAGGGDVTVQAIVERTRSDVSDPALAPDLVLRDAVSGSTAGLLTLGQFLNYDGSSHAGVSVKGDAITSLNAINPGGGALSVDIVAEGGADTVLGDILATSTNGANVDVDVYALGGGQGGTILQENRSPGMPVTPARIYGTSNGGDVRTSVYFTVSGGYLFSTTPDPRNHPDGNSIDMGNVATGDTTGVLALAQFAQAGNGIDESFPLTPPKPAGSGGSARSVLTKHTASESLVLHSEASSGVAGTGSPGVASGGNATAVVDGSNSAGSVQVTAHAGSGFGQGTQGGDAVVEALASTTGDGHEVTVGARFTALFVLPFGGTHLAAGGSVGRCFICPNGTTLAAGGSASSHSTGNAFGDSLVTVFDNAIGGAGGAGRASTVAGFGGAGGSATSVGTATGGGVSTVKSLSEAHGGAGGGFVSQPGKGGDADAFATASGLGRTEASARALGGSSVSTLSPAVGLAGSAIAHATADGASGFVRAEAITGAGDAPQLRAQSEALVGSRRDVASAATFGAALASAPSDPGLEGSAFFTAKPLQADIDAARAANSAFLDRNLLALAKWSGDATDGPLTLSTDLEIALGPADGSRQLQLGAFGTSLIGDGFESLSFSLAKNGVAFGVAETFDTFEEVLAYFASTLLQLGTWIPGDKLLAHFDLALGKASRFEMNLGYATPVPEPSTALLLMLGLIALVSMRRRFAFSA